MNWSLHMLELEHNHLMRVCQLKKGSLLQVSVSPSHDILGNEHGIKDINIIPHWRP